MWQSYYKIAERQFNAGKLTTAEGHALKALADARAANNDKQIAQTLSLLGKLYVDLDSEKAESILRDSVGSAELVYGPNSIELAEQLELLGCILQFMPDSDSSEAARLRALAIRERGLEAEQIVDNEKTQRYLEAIDLLTQFYNDSEQYAKAESQFLRALEVRKKIYGPLGDEIVDEAAHYAEILESQGRQSEVPELDLLMHACDMCEAGDEHPEYPAEVNTILRAMLEEKGSQNLDESIQALRNAVSGLRECIDKNNLPVSASDPFRELKERAKLAPYLWAKSSLGQLIRVKAELENAPSLLPEAAQLLREAVAESGTVSDKLHLLLTVVDLALTDDASYAEAENLLADIPICTATLYTKALIGFRRYGSTSASRAAMKEAVSHNPCVPVALASGGDANAVPDAALYGDLHEAEEYCLEAAAQWNNTPNSTEFMVEVLAQAMPAILRRRLNRLAPRAPEFA